MTSYTIRNIASDGKSITYWDGVNGWRKNPTAAWLTAEAASSALAELEAERPNRAGVREVCPWPTATVAA